MVNSIINRPQVFMWYSIPVLLILGLLRLNTALDIQMHDTYYVIYSLHLSIFFSLILAINGLLYYLMRKYHLIKWITLMHVVVTLALFFIMILMVCFRAKWIEPDLRTYRTTIQTVLLPLIVVVFLQILFLANLIISLIRKKEKSNT